MKKRAVIAMTIVIAAGCSQTMQDQFEYIDKVYEVQMPDDTYRIREHPKGDRLMVTPSLGRVAQAGVVQGLTYGLATTLTPAQAREAAARKYMDDTGRQHCKLVSSRELIKPHFEVLFDCKPA